PSFPEPNNELSSIIINKVSANVSSQNYKSFHFESLNDFDKDKKSFTIDHKESFKEDNLNITEELNQYIAKLGFRDSTSRLFSSFYDSYKLSFEINEITNYKVGNLIKTEFKSTWNISYPYQKTPFYTQSVSSTSNWEVNGKSGSYSMTFKEAVLANVREALLDTNFISNLKASELKKEDSNIRDTIFVSKNFKNISNIESAVKSVVTVQNKNGHGSGCIISNDGYIVTNYHVVSDTTNSRKIIFENGSSVPFEIIRVNELFDLALLKIDTIIDFPVFTINPNQKINLGKEVYAIGTPSDIELGQTLSKGIISGQRIFNDRKLIQTDVSINSGNSGGALIDDQGNLLGIVTSKIVGMGVEGLGFSIPISYINDALLVFTIEEEE
ncbi:MAG TPA: S1C family serine protease, partial [Vicingaceae bacterium]|nr:S1C family serine protease [Vicingaceae bacterium]